LRYQPQSALSKWFVDNYGKRSGRLRRVGIVAVARRLVIALWRLLEHGELPQGAVPKVAA
jgi:transposase